MKSRECLGLFFHKNFYSERERGKKAQDGARPPLKAAWFPFGCSEPMVSLLNGHLKLMWFISISDWLHTCVPYPAVCSDLASCSSPTCPHLCLTLLVTLFILGFPLKCSSDTNHKILCHIEIFAG